jgi:glyoxylase-like metal-dependent hydrolase (beta-lactamase superfamily II)
MPTGAISTQQLQDLLTGGLPVTVVDIRAPADREWSIPGSLQVDAYDAVKSGTLGPLASVDFPPGPVVTVCGMGATAAKAADLLIAQGVRAVPLKGGMRAWSLAWNTAQTSISGCEIVQVRRTGKGCVSYIVASDSQAIVIDASVDPSVYGRLLRERGWRLRAVADTHIHADHLSRSRVLAQQEGVDVWLPAQGRARYPFRAVNSGDRIPFGSAELLALRTPGHTAESTTYLLENAAAFTGDTLFLAGVGRPDLEGGAPEASVWRARLLYESVQSILQLGDSALVLPGHMSEPIQFDARLLVTTVGGIRKTATLTGLDREAFVAAVLARIPSNPPNHSRIVELNERGELPDNPTELEAGANRCAVA